MTQKQQDSMNMGKEAKELYDSLGFYPGIRKITATTKVVRELLLATDAQTFLNGKLWDIESKNIGAGVYKVWLQLRRTP